MAVCFALASSASSGCSAGDELGFGPSFSEATCGSSFVSGSGGGSVVCAGAGANVGIGAGAVVGAVVGVGVGARSTKVTERLAGGDFVVGALAGLESDFGPACLRADAWFARGIVACPAGVAAGVDVGFGALVLGARGGFDDGVVEGSRCSGVGSLGSSDGGDKGIEVDAAGKTT